MYFTLNIMTSIEVLEAMEDGGYNGDIDDLIDALIEEEDLDAQAE